MWVYFERWKIAIESFVMRLDLQDWAVLAAVLIVAGFFCLRGYGSRKDY